jgi:hypothetical protein
MMEKRSLQILENAVNECLERNGDDMDIIILSHYSWNILTWTNVYCPLTPKAICPISLKGMQVENSASNNKHET